MRGLFRHCITISILTSAATISAQVREEGNVHRLGDRAVLIVDAPRPVDVAAITLAREFGIAVSVEDPPYVFKDDVKDVTAEVSRVANPQRRILIPKGGKLEVRFSLKPDGSPHDVAALLQDLVAAANAAVPYAYRLDKGGARYVLIPSRMRDAMGRLTEYTSLLDRRVTIPAGTRAIHASATLMAESLSAQTGLRVSCCQSSVAGIPWGMPEIPFEAKNEPARDILARLIAAASPRRAGQTYWLQRCDPLPSAWCFINLGTIDRPAAPTLAVSPPEVSETGVRWFNPSTVKP